MPDKRNGKISYLAWPNHAAMAKRFRSKTLCFFLLITVLTTVFPTFGQTPHVFHHLSTKNGLSNSNVNAIIKDSYGFLWVATLYGLNRFDGRSHLYKKLMSITGKGPAEFIRTIRLKRGRLLLEKSQMQIAEIAYAVGFNTPKRFTINFKSEFGISPSDYLRSINQTKQHISNPCQKHSSPSVI